MDRNQHRTTIMAALAVGFIGNLFVRTPGHPGLIVFLFFLALALAVGAVCRAARHRVSGEGWAWIIGGVLLGSGFVLRASPPLQAFAFMSAAAAFTFPALRAGAAWLRTSGVSDYIEALGGAALHSGFGGFRVAADVLSAQGGDSARENAGSRVWAVGCGLLLAVPLLLVFGALFVSADQVFAGLVNDLVGTAFEVWAGHVAVTVILAWLATGYLTGFRSGTGLRHVVEGRVLRPSIGIVEAGVALGLVDLLFVAFVAVQFQYLFGGSGLVEVTPGLNYAEYVREGFGQLALASALVLPTLLLSDWLLRPGTARDRAVFRALGGLQLLLLVLIIASAFQRVRAYQEAYGLTEPRFYGAAFLGWLTLLSVWFAATVLRGRRDRFASPALVSGFALIALLFAVNPDVRIARANLARAGVATQATAATDPAFDADYLLSLSADAVPTLLDALPALAPDVRCRVARRLLERWDGEQGMEWRSWNLSVLRARRAVGESAVRLNAMVAAEAGCPGGHDASGPGPAPI